MLANHSALASFYLKPFFFKIGFKKKFGLKEKKMNLPLN